MTKEEALKLTLEALEFAIFAKLEDGTYLDKNCQITMAIAFGKEALAQPEQEPDNFCDRCGKRPT